ncbi:MAG: hypothetical protein JETCAE03_35630 [Ignavibacteriaceae bacterium]|jgi:hypothetical protein|nr:MAG: hypothetical protein JETCAE03_35630 [Ignavibacteriaceae bacterium]
MALTQSNWTERFVNGVYRATCTVISTTAENDAYTKKTPANLDPTKPWTLFYSAAATPDGQALPLDLWVGYSDSFALSGDGASVVATGTGSNYKQIMDDVVLAVNTISYSWQMDPDLAVADVVTVGAIATGLKIKVPVAPYYAFNLDGGSTLAATTHTFTIVQKLDKEGVSI